MRRAARVDANQQEIVRAFRQAGITVQVLSSVGKGCPDILAGFRGINCLVELKDGSKPASGQSLTKDQVDWHMNWNGHVVVANSVSAAIEAVIIHAKETGKV